VQYAKSAWVSANFQPVGEYAMSSDLNNYYTKTQCDSVISTQCQTKADKQDLKNWVENVKELSEIYPNTTVACYIGNESKYTYGGLYKNTITEGENVYYFILDKFPSTLDYFAWESDYTPSDITFTKIIPSFIFWVK